MTDTERLLEIIRVKNLNNIQFCSITGISPASLSHITSNRSKPTLSILRNVISGFPDINPEWIMMGTGPMFKGDNGGKQKNDGGDAELTGKKDSEGMSSLFTDDETDETTGYASAKPRQENSWTMQPASGSIEDIVKKTLTVVQKPQRKIVEVRIFFDDGTYESFGGKAAAK